VECTIGANITNSLYASFVGIILLFVLKICVPVFDVFVD